jgi:TPR repeat protein
VSGGAARNASALPLHMALGPAEHPTADEAFQRSWLLPVQHVQRDIPSALGTAGRPIPLRLDIPAEFRKAQFLVIRGLPHEISVSSGFRAGTAWYVPFEELAGLEINSSPDFTGNFVFDATLFKELNGSPIGQIYVTVAIQAPRAAGAQGTTAALGQAPPAPAPRSRRKLSSADELTAFARGTALMGKGDVVTARLVFLDLAKRGSANGARAMGETYDPAVLSRIFIAGLKPDPEIAGKWYRLAAEMGDKQAEERLAALAQP